ncbi:MAG: nitrogen regulation protein NR(II), partial [Gammaproteobacteria bacterium]|nr:nitrogen regulation protein NR(II) [Gammaproteobacteria bacterium]
LTPIDRLLQRVKEENHLDQHAANQAVLRGLAHEIKNPLGGLRGAAQLLDGELPNRELREYTRIIIHEADRLSTLVDRMMGSYKPIQSVALNVHEVLEHIRKLILVDIQEGLNIERDYDPSLPEIIGDRDQLVQAVLNIVRNAVQALEQQGSIRLRTRIERNPMFGRIRHRHGIRVDIEDDGPGVPRELTDQIFYPLVTGRAEGTGLGLSIAQDIVAKHGGYIEFTSKPGHTRFSMVLPVTKAGNDE